MVLAEVIDGARRHDLARCGRGASVGKPCVAGAQTLEVDEKHNRFAVNGRSIAEGDWITVDGSTGKVFAGQAALVAPK